MYNLYLIYYKINPLNTDRIWLWLLTVLQTLMLVNDCFLVNVRQLEIYRKRSFYIFLQIINTMNGWTIIYFRFITSLPSCTMFRTRLIWFIQICIEWWIKVLPMYHPFIQPTKPISLATIFAVILQSCRLRSQFRYTDFLSPYIWQRKHKNRRQFLWNFMTDLVLYNNKKKIKNSFKRIIWILVEYYGTNLYIC